ncbi:class I SAM-dependent methyltransferase [Rapidithrix thailandica]|uniref:Class I SAM-dependent methyltransferase n=1 Tax=Rapidithrix thailandica TaxID=413964 RepID=A0AAW9S7A5_9BACT
MFSTTEITSHEEQSDNVIHQRLYFAYVEAAKRIKGNVLEIGCGAGRGLETIIKASDSFTAIDKNEKLLTLHGQQYLHCHFLHQSVPPLEGLEDNEYDYVLSFQVIEHIEDDDLFVKEIHRVLKPGGKAIITTPNIHMSLTRNPWHVREYTAKQMKDLMGRYFDKVEVKGITGNHKVMKYYEDNKASVKKITRFDVFNLQYRLPRKFLQVPYDLLNRVNRKKLQKGNDELVLSVKVEDYHFADYAEDGFDFFCIVEKNG